MKPETRVAVVGAGQWGKNLVRNFADLGALRTICDASEAHRDAMRRLYPAAIIASSVDEVLRDEGVAAVAIATPAETHGELVRVCLEAGKDVMVEKPLCLSVREGEDLVDLARRNRRILMVGHLLWYHPTVLKLKEICDSGRLGRIQYIYSNRLNLGRIRNEENILWSFAPHDVSVLLGLLGEMPDQVYAQGGNYLRSEIADVTMTLFGFPSGVKAHIFVSWLHPFKEQKLVVVGDRSMAVFNDLEPRDKLLVYPHTIDWQGGIPVASKADATVIEHEWWEPLRQECTHFLQCVAERTKPLTDGEEGLRVLRVLDECQGFLTDGTTVAGVGVTSGASLGT